MRRTLPGLLVLLAAGLVVGGCAATHGSAPGAVVIARKGPPPHAPAHGYRHKHPDGTELVFNSRLGVYVVVGRDDRYYLDGWYFRYAGSGWECCARLDGRWVAADDSDVPPGLRRHGHPGGKSSARGHASAR